MQDIVKRFGSLSEEIIKSYAIQLIQGLQYLQKNGFFISQIKSKKILIANDGTLNLLPEFGDNKSNENENQSLIISFGHILLEMLTGKLIDTNAKYDIDKIKSGKELKKLIKNCFTSEIHCEKNLDYLMEFAFLTE